MKDIIISAIVLGFISAIARFILPYSQKLVEWLINKLVAKAEIKINGSKMGAQKKEYVCKRLRVFGVKSNEFINNMIDGAVEAMNNKELDVSSAFKNEIKETLTEQIENTVEKSSETLKNKLSKE